jgi:tripartite-type tricarboxylate transporter receptor subunit TctC
VVPDFNYDAAVRLIARAGVPQSIIDPLAQALARVVLLPEVVTGFAKTGLEPVSKPTPERLAERMREDRRKHQGVIRKIEVTAD